MAVENRALQRSDHRQDFRSGDEALERVVKKCLAKTPGDPYHTMHDLADELR